ncbi:MAG: PIG-L family deacetylase [Verrucomicrobia bacterium]|nr:PIG-L family deacetylase [Verrucomicrobiota bacterium]
MNPYQTLVANYARYFREGKSHPLGGFLPTCKPTLQPSAPKALIFSPHPDDECIIGALPLRLLREAKLNVINVAVTQGSNKTRQTERYHELQAACGFIGFGLIQTRPGGLEKIGIKTRAQDAATWAQAVQIIAKILQTQSPRVIFFPHEHDWNSSHIGTHFLVLDALATLPKDFTCHLVETEYWGAMASPNLMIESNETDVADLVKGVSFHVGEVRRNPFHLLLPAWMQDNVRRGSELVGGQGEAAPDFGFATLYRLRRWQHGGIVPAFAGGRKISRHENPASLFP